ncbi:MAG TPA: hypothetical protein VLA51_00725, partial [Paracoccaceae bacterium]|nr:hypothetical protein [Paracoccaceae bacterium]
DIFDSFKLSAVETEAYDTVMARFDNHFVIRRNVIFERAQFNMRKQALGETSEAFIIALHKLAETCDFGALHDELIRDRIVVGIQDAKLSERLQLDRELTLDKAVSMVRQAEQVHQQQSLLRTTSPNSATCEVNAVKRQQRDRPQKNCENQTASPNAIGAADKNTTVKCVQSVKLFAEIAGKMEIFKNSADQIKRAFAPSTQRPRYS